MLDYETALQQLHQAPLASFVAERKRLAAALRAQGDEFGAAQIAKRAKPLTSVWVVNQLYWQARGVFDALLAAAARVRAGERGAASAHREALATLRGNAARLLKEGGYAVSDEILRRVAATLAAIAVAGSFAPDPPGALSADRDPPGFETVSLAVPPDRAHREAPGAERERAGNEARLRAAQERQREQREAAERARRTAERSRLQSALRTATAALRTQERARALLAQQLHDAESAVTAARQRIEDLERQLAALEDAD